MQSSSTIDSISPEEESINAVLRGVETECTDEKANDEDGTMKKVEVQIRVILRTELFVVILIDKYLRNKIATF